MVEERGDFGLAHLQRVALAVKVDKTLDPLDVGLLRARAVVPPPDGIAHLVEQARAFGRTVVYPFIHSNGTVVKSIEFT